MRLENPVPRKSRSGSPPAEDNTIQGVMASPGCVFPGCHPSACVQTIRRERGSPAGLRLDLWFQTSCKKQGWDDQPAGVGTAHSTPSLGEPSTWGRGCHVFTIATKHDLHSVAEGRFLTQRGNYVSHENKPAMSCRQSTK